MHCQQVVRAHWGHLQGRLKRAQSLVAGPKHPSSGAGTIFGKPRAEVHALLPQPRSATSRLPAVKAMLQTRKQRHAAAWHEFEAKRDAAQELMCEHMKQESSTAVQKLQVSRDSIEADMAQLAPEQVTFVNEEQLMAVRLPSRRMTHKHLACRELALCNSIATLSPRTLWMQVRNVAATYTCGRSWLVTARSTAEPVDRGARCRSGSAQQRRCRCACSASTSCTLRSSAQKTIAAPFSPHCC